MEWNAQAEGPAFRRIFQGDRMKKHVAWLAMASAFSLAPFGASAQVPLLWCNGCSQQQERRAAAQELDKENTDPTAPARDMIYVGNNGAIHKYSVFVGSRIGESSHGDDGMPRWTAVPMAVEPRVQAAFNDLMAFYNTAPVGWTKTFTVKIMAPPRAMPTDEGMASPRGRAEEREHH
jgi:hypothetical protein